MTAAHTDNYEITTQTLTVCVSRLAEDGTGCDQQVACFSAVLPTINGDPPTLIERDHFAAHLEQVLREWLRASNEPAGRYDIGTWVDERHGDFWARVAHRPEPDSPLHLAVGDTFDRLTVVQRIWPADHTARWETAREIDPSLDHAAWLADETPDFVILTSDGADARIGVGASLGSCCNCQPAPLPARWVRYERWTPTGRADRGSLCETCRRITRRV